MTAVASPAPGGRGKKNSYTKEIRTSAASKTSPGYSNVKDAKERMKTPLSKYDTPKMELKRGVKEEFDTFNYLLEYLVAEGYADTNKAAIAIMANMSEEWRTEILLGEGVIDFVKSGVERHQSAMKGAKEAKKRHDDATKKLRKTVEPVVRDAKTAVKKGGEIAGAVGRGIKAAAAAERKGAAAVHRFGDKLNAARKAFAKEDLEFIAQYVIDEGYDLSDYTWEEFAEICEAQEARNNPEKYEREQAKAKSKKQKAMEDPHTGINSPAFEKFMRQQMGR